MRARERAHLLAQTLSSSCQQAQLSSGRTLSSSTCPRCAQRLHWGTFPAVSQQCCPCKLTVEALQISALRTCPAELAPTSTNPLSFGPLRRACVPRPCSRARLGCVQLPLPRWGLCHRKPLQGCHLSCRLEHSACQPQLGSSRRSLRRQCVQLLPRLWVRCAACRPSCCKQVGFQAPETRTPAAARSLALHSHS